MSFDAPDSFEPGTGIAAEVKNACIGDGMEQSYIDYAMSVITGWALPNVRDDLKLVHRHILYMIYQTGMTSNLSHRKSSFIVGETMSDYHLHGDSVIYDTLACTAQNFSIRYPLVNSQGNLSSADGDPLATMRYTETRMSPTAEELLDDIDKDTVDSQSSYDDHKQELAVLPSSLLNLLVNGSPGIAVGMSMNIPPHNLGEVIDATVEFIENPDTTTVDLMEHIKGPDFLTDANIVGHNAVHRTYRTGHGRVRVRIDYDVFRKEDRIVISELPYQENKARLIERIADDVNRGKIEGVRGIRDESDRDDVRVVIELKRDVMAEVAKNQQLDNHLEPTSGIINLALVDGQSQVLTLKKTLERYLDHRRDVVRWRSECRPAEAEGRAHILDDRLEAPDNIDDVVKTIRNSKSRDNAKAALRGEVEVEAGGEPLPTLDFFGEQANRIASMQLGPLISMEVAEIEVKYEDVQATTERLKTIPGDQSKLGAVIESGLLDIKDGYADDRRTSFVANTGEATHANLIPERDMIAVVSEDNYIKRMSVSRLRDQHRDGKGIIGTDLKEGDGASSVFVTNAHDDLLCFTNHGQVYQLRVYQVPEMSRIARRRLAVDLLDFNDGEEITTVVNRDDLRDIEDYLAMVTQSGYIERTGTDHSQNIPLTGVIVTRFDKDDELVDAKVAGGESDLIIGTKREMSIRFDEDEMRAMGRSARDVHGIKLGGDDVVAGVTAIDEDRHSWVLTATKNDYGKHTGLDAYHTQSRNGKGLIGIKASKRNNPIYAIDTVGRGDHLVVISDEGQVLRAPAEDISTVGRNTIGVIVTDLDEGGDTASVDMIPVAVTTGGEELGNAGSMEEDTETDTKADAKVDADSE